MSLPFNLATSTTYNPYHISEQMLVPVERIDELPQCASLWKGSIYIMPGLTAPNGFKFYQCYGTLVCLVARRLQGFNSAEFDKACERIRQSINWEHNRVDGTYKHQPFKRLIGLSQLHAYRTDKRETTKYIRECIGLEEHETVSFLTPSAAASTVKSVRLIDELSKLPIPVAVIRNHHIDGHIYLSLGRRGFNNCRVPVALVSGINKESLASIREMVNQNRQQAEEAREYWIERLNTIAVTMSIIKRGE